MSTQDSLPDSRLEFLQGTLDVLVLRGLQLGPMHAHGLAQWIERQSDDTFAVEHGSLYPALQRLLQRGWIDARWEQSPNSRRARYYRLTTAGREAVTQATTKWQRFVEAMARVLAPES